MLENPRKCVKQEQRLHTMSGLWAGRNSNTCYPAGWLRNNLKNIFASCSTRKSRHHSRSASRAASTCSSDPTRRGPPQINSSNRIRIESL
ncbi:hypothetical protein CPSG_03935 [Coccidioides posadasii str. Silveira]|uniref:Uncharacterized protein n=1 Tax=Coccidioides posadasii (strain RMSCC 757 / Silveira) TaxID=443226 RepID=E9D2Y7_COCPS|nr:hypothetical protein CPSG_03935 [Coccidioides posadasii str. Silveira]